MVLAAKLSYQTLWLGQMVDKFREVYKNLYNSASTQEEMAMLQTRVAELIKVNSMDEVDKVTGTRVKKAVCLMKPYKGDVSEGYSSDALLHGPDICLICLP